MKEGDAGFCGFGEAYFSSITCGEIKGWKKHTKMTLNLIVPVGEIEFVLYDGNAFFNLKLSIANYQRLTIHPNLWVAFRGLSAENILLNIASVKHDPGESINRGLDEIRYEW